jgi:hypothetical protein
MRRANLEPIHSFFLQTAERLVEASDTNGVEPSQVLEVLCLDEADADMILDVLIGAGLVVWPSRDQALITEAGRGMVERLRETESTPQTTRFVS